MVRAEWPALYIRELLERYALEVIPIKAIATQQGDNASLVNLRKIVGDMRLVDIEPQHIYKYADTRHRLEVMAALTNLFMVRRRLLNA